VEIEASMNNVGISGKWEVEDNIVKSIPRVYYTPPNIVCCRRGPEG
jgi:hypothetical protein